MSRRWGFLLSFVTLAVGYTVFWVTPAMGGFVASVVLVGLSFRGAYTICAASAGDYVAPVLSAAAFGLMAVGAGLGQAIGALVGGRAADQAGLEWVFVLATGAAAVGAVAASFSGARPPNCWTEPLQRHASPGDSRDVGPRRGNRGDTEDLSSVGPQVQVLGVVWVKEPGRAQR